MSDNLTLEKVEQDLKSLKGDLGRLRGYVSAHRTELSSLATTNLLNKQFGKYLPNGYAFKKNYNVLSIRAVNGRNKPSETKIDKRPRRIIQPSEMSSDDSEDISDSSDDDSDYDDEPPQRPSRPPEPKIKRTKSVPKKVKYSYQEPVQEEIPQVNYPQKPISNKNIARSFFQEKARKLYHNF